MFMLILLRAEMPIEGGPSTARCSTLFLVICAVATRCNGTKHTRHHGQDSVDKSFSKKIVFNSVNSWCTDYFWFKHDVAGRICTTLECWFVMGNNGCRFQWGANHATSLEVFLVTCHVTTLHAILDLCVVQRTSIGSCTKTASDQAITCQWLLEPCSRLPSFQASTSPRIITLHFSLFSRGNDTYVATHLVRHCFIFASSHKMSTIFNGHVNCFAVNAATLLTTRNSIWQTGASM